MWHELAIDLRAIAALPQIQKAFRLVCADFRAVGTSPRTCLKSDTGHRSRGRLSGAASGFRLPQHALQYQKHFV